MRAPIRLSCLFLLLAACQAPHSPSATGSTAALPPLERCVEPERGFDCERYSLRLELLPEQRALQGTARLRLVATQAGQRQVRIDMEELEVLAVRELSGAPIAYQQDAQGLSLRRTRACELGEAWELEIDYRGQPRRGLFFARERNGVATQAWTQGECRDARAWFPCFDTPSDRATGELIVRVPRSWSVIAAGERLSREESAEHATEHWRMDVPHPAYLVTLVAGELVETLDQWNGVPLSYWVAPDQQALVATSFGSTPEILEFFSNWTGLRYPYPKYAQVSVDNFAFGGMENISASTLTERALVDELALRDGGMDGLVAHEAAHQWFGDLVTCHDWSQAWLNEGFATYATALYKLESQGSDEFELDMDDMAQGMAERARTHPPRAIVWDWCRDPMELFLSRHIYTGAAQRLRWLHESLGDELFRKGVRLYLSRHAHSSARSSDLRAALEAVGGQGLESFFQQWLETPGIPRLELKWRRDAAQARLLVSIDQTQAVEAGVPACFRFDSELEIMDRSGPKRVPIRVDARKVLVEFAAPEEVLWVRFDPRGLVPKEYQETHSAEAWLELARSAREVATRRRALREVRAFPQAQALYLERLSIEPVARLRAECAAGLDPRLSPEARTALIKAATSDEHAAVRAQALQALCLLPSEAELTQLAQSMCLDPYSYAVLSAAAQLFVVQAPELARARLLEWAAQASPLERRAAACVPALQRLGEQEQLARWAMDETRGEGLREACVRALCADARTTRDQWLSWLRSPSFRLRRAAIEALPEDRRIEERAQLLQHWHASPIVPERVAVEQALRTRSP